MAEFLHMGGFAWFIWPTYVVTLGFMIGITVVTLRGLAADRRTLAELEQGAPHRARRRAGAGFASFVAGTDGTASGADGSSSS
jgi:heme exporter protein D